VELHGRNYTLILAGSDFHSLAPRISSRTAARKAASISWIWIRTRQSGHEFLASHPVDFVTLVSSPFRKTHSRHDLRDVIFPLPVSLFILLRKIAVIYPIDRAIPMSCHDISVLWLIYPSESIKKHPCDIDTFLFRFLLNKLTTLIVKDF